MKQPSKCKRALLLTPNDHDVVDAHKSDGTVHAVGVNDDVDDVYDADDKENEEQEDKAEQEDCWMMRRKSRYCELSIIPCLINFFAWITLLIAPLVSN